MLEQLFSLAIQIAISLLVMKLYTDFQSKKAVKNAGAQATKTTTHWSDASEIIAKLEARIAELQNRDSVSQDKVWNLEDQNRILKLHMAEIKRQHAACMLNAPDGTDVDDDTD